MSIVKTNWDNVRKALRCGRQTVYDIIIGIGEKLEDLQETVEGLVEGGTGTGSGMTDDERSLLNSAVQKIGYTSDSASQIVIKTLDKDDEELDSSVTLEGASTTKAGCMTAQDKSDLNALIAHVYPLTASYATKNDGVREVGTSVTPSVTLSITRRGADVTASSTVTAAGTTIAADKKSWTAPAISSGSVTYATKVTQGGQEVTLDSLTWSFHNYKYYGTVSSAASITSAVIKGLSKSLTSSIPVSNMTIATGKYAICAVPTSLIPSGKKMMFQDVATSGQLTSETKTGTITLQRVNETANVDYTYIYTDTAAGADGKLNVILVNL